MGLDNLRRRLNHIGGADPRDRMKCEKLRSMLQAAKYSYQGAELSRYSDNTTVFPGLMNPVAETEDYDNKLISAAFDNNLAVGDVVKWHETATLWIIFTQDRSEVAYFRGKCRRCDYFIKWVDGERREQSTPAAVIGPQGQAIKSSSGAGRTKAETDVPMSTIKFLIPDTEVNRGFFHRYQTFMLKGTAYILESINNLSMPGILKLEATEHYANLVEDDVEENLRNAWNVQPVVTEHPTEFAITGPDTLKPGYKAVYASILDGGEWVIVENIDTPLKRQVPAKIAEGTEAGSVIVYWDSMKGGQFTLGYRQPNGALYQKHIIVESLM